MTKKSTKKVKILVTCPYTGKFQKGDVAKVLEHHKRKTAKHPYNFLVELPRNISLGGRKLARRRQFMNNEVEEL